MSCVRRMEKKQKKRTKKNKRKGKKKKMRKKKEKKDKKKREKGQEKKEKKGKRKYSRRAEGAPRVFFASGWARRGRATGEENSSSRHISLTIEKKQ